MKARCWFEEEPRVDFIRNIAPWDADDLDADRSRGLRLAESNTPESTHIAAIEGG